MAAKKIRTRRASVSSSGLELELVVRVRVNPSDVEHLQRVVDHCAASKAGSCWPPIDSLDDLLTMLVDDLAHVSRRPGSWEGAHMIQVLSGHGYFND